MESNSSFVFGFGDVRNNDVFQWDEKENSGYFSNKISPAWLFIKSSKQGISLLKNYGCLVMCWAQLGPRHMKSQAWPSADGRAGPGPGQAWAWASIV